MAVANNPIATEEQCKHERLALELFGDPSLVRARDQVCSFWLDEVKPSEEMRGCFEWAFEEVMFGAVIWALNQDPLYPAVITITRLPHHIGGVQIPGSRWGIDNPDSVYRVIPISGEESYEITGRVAERRLVENYFTLWDRDMKTVGLLSGKDLAVSDDGRFAITVDDKPAKGRINHIQSCASAHEFYIRDVILDWKRDRPNELSVKRLGSPPSRPPRSRGQLLSIAEEYMFKWARNTIRWNNQALLRPANDFSFTIDRDTDGALRNQIYVMGHFKLPSREHALILEVDMGGADYFIAPITNIWGTTNEIVHRNGCLNKAQASANPDGTYTFVLSVEDPGVYNWLDPTDMHEGILTLRWAEFRNGWPTDTFGVRSALVGLEELRASLGPWVEKVSPSERIRLSEQRRESYQWRLAEN